MSIVKRNNLAFPELMNEIFKPDWFGGIENQTNHIPPVNIIETETGFELELSVPGIKKEELVIEVDNNVLTISSDVKKDEAKKEDQFRRREFSKACFKRSFTMAKSIDTEAIKADYENGILRFVLPKKEEALPKPKKTISLS